MATTQLSHRPFFSAARTVLCCSATLGALAYLLAPSQARAAAPAPEGVGPIQSALGDICLDPGAPPVNSGDNVQVWGCNDSYAHFGWYFTKEGEIRNKDNPHKCLDVWGTSASPGVNVKMANCHGGPNQTWRMTESGELRTALDEGYCLDVSGGHSSWGANVQIWPCNGTEAQTWNMALLPWAQFESDLGDLCMDVQGDGETNNVQLWHCHDDSSTQFMLTPDGELRSAVGANRCVDVAGGSFQDGSNIQVWDCNGTSAQRWTQTGNGELRSTDHPEYCIDVHMGYAAAGTNVKLQTCNDNAAQKWSSNGMLGVSLEKIQGGSDGVEGHLAFVFSSGTEGWAVTDPTSILQLIEKHGFDETALVEALDLMSDIQLDVLEQTHGANYTVAGVVGGEPPAATLMESVELEGPSGGFRFKAAGNGVDGLNGIDGRIGVDLAELQVHGFELEVTGPEAVGMLMYSDGGFALSVGASLISVELQTGSEDGSHVGLNYGVGVGFDGAVKWGQNGQVGFSIDLKFIAVTAYLHTDDIERAAQATLDGLEDGATDVAAFAEDAYAWSDGAVQDTEAWLGGASQDAASWTVTAAEDVAGAAEHALNWFGSIF